MGCDVGISGCGGMGMGGGGVGPAELGIPRCIQGQLSGIYDRSP